MTRDPFAGLVQVPQTLHPYVYVGNNPVNLTDPSGEIVPLIVLGLFVAGGFIGGVGAYTIQAYLYPNPCGGAQWDPVSALVWGGGGALLGAVMFSVGYGGYALAVHFGWVTPAVGPLLRGPITSQYQRYANNTTSLLPQVQRTTTRGVTAISSVGQRHHLLTNRIMEALEVHPKLGNIFDRQDPRLISRARDIASHIGYETWHREYDERVVAWLQSPQNRYATWQQFTQFLHNIYQEPGMRERIPGVDLRGWMP